MNNSSTNVQLQQSNPSLEQASSIKMEEHEATEKTVDDSTEVGPELPDERVENGKPIVPLMDVFSRIKLVEAEQSTDNDSDGNEPGPMPAMQGPRGSFALPMFSLSVPNADSPKQVAEEESGEGDDSEPEPMPKMQGPRGSLKVPMFDLDVLGADSKKDASGDEDDDDSEPAPMPTMKAPGFNVPLLDIKLAESPATPKKKEIGKRENVQTLGWTRASGRKTIEHSDSLLAEPEPAPELASPPSFKAIPFHNLNASVAERRARVQRRQDSRKKHRRAKRKPVRMSWRRGSVTPAELNGLLGTLRDLDDDDDDVKVAAPRASGKIKRRPSKAPRKPAKKTPALARIDSSIEEPEPVGTQEPVKMMPFLGLGLSPLSIRRESILDESVTQDETDSSMSPGAPIKMASAVAVPEVEVAPYDEERVPSAEDEVLAMDDIQLEELKKHKILGEGIFGQVWMVSDSRRKTNPIPYALKIQSKYELVAAEQAYAIIHEKEAMEAMDHPFIIGLVKTFQDDDFIYILLEFLRGGELFTVLHGDLGGASGLPEMQAKFYSICVADAIAHIHSKKYVYRDLKPENVMIDERGYPVVIDFGCAKLVTEKTFTLVGTPRCVPPEIINSTGHDWSADHWSFGILIYELVTGENPFFFEGMDQMSLFHSIEHDGYPEPENLSDEGKDLIAKLLQKEATNRIGSLEGGEDDILKHPWFNGLLLNRMRRREMRAPWTPPVKDGFDTSNFDDWSDLEDKTLQPSMRLDRRDAELFKDF